MGSTSNLQQKSVRSRTRLATLDHVSLSERGFCSFLPQCFGDIAVHIQACPILPGNQDSLDALHIPEAAASPGLSFTTLPAFPTDGVWLHKFQCGHNQVPPPPYPTSPHLIPPYLPSQGHLTMLSVPPPPDHSSTLRVRTGSGVPSVTPGATRWRSGRRGPAAAVSRAQSGQMVFKLWQHQQVHREDLQQRVGWRRNGGRDTWHPTHFSAP